MLNYKKGAERVDLGISEEWHKKVYILLASFKKFSFGRTMSENVL